MSKSALYEVSSLPRVEELSVGFLESIDPSP
jgi:hypothetical protein